VPPLGVRGAASSRALLAPLARTLADNVAVLTGRAPAAFTARTNSCMWCARVNAVPRERNCVFRTRRCDV
jgi:hypothetical protein